MTATVDADQKNGQDIFAVSSRDAEIAVKNSKSSLAPLTRRQLFIIFSLSYGNFCMGCIYSLLAPFFPKEVSRLARLTQFSQWLCFTDTSGFYVV